MKTFKNDKITLQFLTWHSFLMFDKNNRSALLVTYFLCDASYTCINKLYFWIWIYKNQRYDLSRYSPSLQEEQFRLISPLWTFWLYLLYQLLHFLLWLPCLYINMCFTQFYDDFIRLTDAYMHNRILICTNV
jgi:hypothetical protein